MTGLPERQVWVSVAGGELRGDEPRMVPGAVDRKAEGCPIAALSDAPAGAARRRDRCTASVSGFPNSHVGVHLRLAMLSDLPALMRIEREAFGREAWTEPMVRDELTGPARYYIVAERADGVVGYAGVFLGDAPDIMTVGVLPVAQGQGIGRAMVRDVLDAAARTGAPAVFLEVREDNTPAIGLYTSLGFTPVRVRRHYYGPGSHAVVMSLDLPPPDRRVSPFRAETGRFRPER